MPVLRTASRSSDERPRRAWRAPGPLLFKALACATCVARHMENRPLCGRTIIAAPVAVRRAACVRESVWAVGRVPEIKLPQVSAFSGMQPRDPWHAATKLQVAFSPHIRYRRSFQKTHSLAAFFSMTPLQSGFGVRCDVAARFMPWFAPLSVSAAVAGCAKEGPTRHAVRGGVMCNRFELGKRWWAVRVSNPRPWD